ncbi:hypothetical protein QAD02_020546 [Eretmocerus hayati]|uniref:Uncharacterized protein n=1 Tax=Eretmocerus hayati TaxID=131215 RepID=A0ACC2PNR1_9HYME|nr:hypothetical protein QAD02_020546 [Eretmocerus hayati]
MGLNRIQLIIPARATMSYVMSKLPQPVVTPVVVDNDDESSHEKVDINYENDETENEASDPLRTSDQSGDSSEQDEVEISQAKTKKTKKALSSDSESEKES